MNEQEAVHWVRLGLTPKWLEAMWTAGHDTDYIAESFTDQTGSSIGTAEVECLILEWGIEL